MTTTLHIDVKIDFFLKIILTIERLSTKKQKKRCKGGISYHQSLLQQFKT